MEIVIALSLAAFAAAAALAYLVVLAFSKIKNLFASRQIEKGCLNYPLFRK